MPRPKKSKSKNQEPEEEQPEVQPEAEPEVKGKGKGKGKGKAKQKGAATVDLIIETFRKGAEMVRHDEGWTGVVAKLLKEKFENEVSGPQRGPKVHPPIPEEGKKEKKLNLPFKTQIWVRNILKHYIEDPEVEFTGEDFKVIGPLAEKIIKFTLVHNEATTTTALITTIRGYVHKRYPEPSDQYTVIRNAKYFGAREEIAEKNKQTRKRTAKQQHSLQRLPVSRAYEIIHDLKMLDTPAASVLMLGIACGARYGEILHKDITKFEPATIQKAIKFNPAFGKDGGDKDKHEWIKQTGFEKRNKIGKATRDEIYKKNEAYPDKEEIEFKNYVYRPLVGLKSDEFFKRLEQVREAVAEFVDEHPKYKELSKTNKVQEDNYYSRISKTIFRHGKGNINELLDEYFPEHKGDEGATQNRTHSCRKMYAGLSHYEFGWHRKISLAAWITDVLGHSGENVAAHYTKYDFVSQQPPETKQNEALEQRLQQMENKTEEANERAKTAQETVLKVQEDTNEDRKLVKQSDKPWEGPEIGPEEIEKEIKDNWNEETNKFKVNKRKRTMRERAIRCLAMAEILTRKNWESRTTTLRNCGLGADLVKYFRVVMAYTANEDPGSVPKENKKKEVKLAEGKEEKKKESEPESESKESEAKKEPDAEPANNKFKAVLNEYEFEVGPGLRAVKDKDIKALIKQLWDKENERFNIIKHSKDPEKAKYEKFVLIAAGIVKLHKMEKIASEKRGPSLREMISIGLNRRHFDLFNQDRHKK